MLDIDEVAAWASKNGFVKIGPWSFRVSYHTFNVVMELGFKGVTTYALRPDGKDVLARALYEEIELDDNGMLRGAGLHSEFVDRIARGEPCPRWFSLEHRRNVEAHLAKKLAPPRQMPP